MLHSATRGENTARKVVLIGAESTGKTTLAQRLAAHYGTVWTPEYARLFVEQEKRPPVYEDVKVIALGHLHAVATMLPQAHRVHYCDTDLIATYVYSRYYFGNCPDWVEQASYAQHAALYLLTATDIPWEPDPDQRESPEARNRLQVFFVDELQRRGVFYVPIMGPAEERLSTAVAAVDRIL
jgi:NadR type nicotinamide-nucleotide adenylyltransferase